jgi:adenine/guanine phosphoribosyltransferase-like PRPP-binding protein
MIYSGHIGYLDDISHTVRQTTETLRPFKSRFDCIVATGMSGALVASPVAIRLHRPLVILRKPSDDCHDGSDIINPGGIGKRWLFLDDFMSLGSTFRRVRGRMTDLYFIETRHIGSYFYGTQELTWQPTKARARAKTV